MVINTVLTLFTCTDHNNVGAQCYCMLRTITIILQKHHFLNNQRGENDREKTAQLSLP